MADWKLQVRNLQIYSIPQTFCLWTGAKHHKKYDILAHNVMK